MEMMGEEIGARGMPSGSGEDEVLLERRRGSRLAGGGGRGAGSLMVGAGARVTERAPAERAVG
jgi:hypothetical protein